MAHKPDPDPFKVFLNATSYWRAASALTFSLKVRPPYDTPIFVLEAFSLELHLKCLLRVRGKLLDATHEPRELFAKLDLPDQQLIVTHAKILPTDADININSLLQRSEGIFKNLRYLHEGHDWPSDSDGVGGNFGFCEVIRALRLIILAANSNWEADYKLALGDDVAASTTHIPESLNAKTILQIVPPSTGS